jgi:hypothetical protein
LTATVTLTPTITLSPTITTTSAATDTPTPSTGFYLSANLFNTLSGPPLVIHYQVTSPGEVKLVIYDVAANRVRRLLDLSQTQGTYSLPFEGNDDDGKALATGLYFVVLTQPDGNQILKVLAVKQ